MKEIQISNNGKVVANVRNDEGKIKIVYTGELATKSITDSMFKEIEEKFQLEKGAAIDSLAFSESVKDVAARSFDSKKIRKVIVRSSNLKSIGAFAFAGSDIETIDLDWKNKPHETASYFINDDKGLMIIAEGAFINNKIKKITLPNTIRKIEERAFAYNNIEVTIMHPKTVDNVMGSAFLGNENNKFYRLEERKNEKIKSQLM